MEPEQTKDGAAADTGSKWWVDTDAADRPKAKSAPVPVGMRFYACAHDFQQERARDRLTDNNLRLLLEVNPPAGEWTIVRLAETSFPDRERVRIEKLVTLSSWARGILVDCGRSVRLLVTGTPVGQRILELTLNEAPSFDAWIDHEWVQEEIYPDGDAAIRAFRRHLRGYLSPESILRHESIVARA